MLKNIHTPTGVSPLANAGGCEPQRQSEVHIELDLLAKSADYTAELLNRLESRLNPVTRQAPCPQAGSQSVPASMLVPLADAIRSQRNKIESLTMQLDYLLSNIEL